jgi:hypothetical protein
MIGFHETLNDDRRYDVPSALTLRWDERRRYAYDHESVAAAIRRNMLASPHTQYPCEPHMIFPICNTFALNTLLMVDRLHGTALTGDLVERVRDAYAREGYLRPDGRFVSGRTTFGMTILPPPRRPIPPWPSGCTPPCRTWPSAVGRGAGRAPRGGRPAELTARRGARGRRQPQFGRRHRRVFTMAAARGWATRRPRRLSALVRRAAPIARRGARQYADSTLANASFALAPPARWPADPVPGAVPVPAPRAFWPRPHTRTCWWPGPPDLVLRP